VAITPHHCDPRPGDVRHSHADISAARRDLGYEPEVGFHEGLARTLAWFRERAPLIPAVPAGNE
jgi:nucleoside-diphosphate-sugar epimerase